MPSKQKPGWLCAATRLQGIFCLLLTLLCLSVLPAQFAPAHAQSAFARSLPEQLFSDPQLCAYAPCAEVLPGADSFSARQGRPAYVVGYRGEGDKRQLQGYVFLSTDIVDIPGYSGKPIITLIGMDRQGVITGVRILKHSEPLLLSGIPESVLIDFVNQYVGKYIGDKIEIGESRPNEGVIGLDAITAATVTVISQNQVILHSGIAIARQAGILKHVERPPARLMPASAAPAELPDWPALLREGSLQRLHVEASVLGLPLGERPYMDLYFGYLNAPDIGRSLLGEDGYENLMSRLKKNEHAIVLLANGTESFKGEGFVHGGIFDRILVRQEMDSFTFRDIDSLLLDRITAAGAPVFSETAIFILRNPHFSAAYPWHLVFRASKFDPRSNALVFTNFEQNYWLPDNYLQDGRPSYRAPDPAWLGIWKKRPLEITLFLTLLLLAAVVYALRDELSRRASRKDKRWVAIPKYTIWLASIGFVGFYLMAQPSITQVLTLLHALLFKWEWPLFLSDPFIFLFWWFIIITVFVWGRGLFCGWLCPYGTMSELLYKIGGKIGLKRWQRQLSPALHDKLKWLKYVIFFALFIASFYSMEVAEQLAEVEPFKTTFLIGVWNRSWPFVLFWTVLIVAALFTERPYCKYLCPLGAGLAIPSTFRWWGLKRKQECGPCKACAVGCESHAIDQVTGEIDQRECLACMDCVVLYYDDHSCPPLTKERKQRQKAGLPLTRVASNGYHIPIVKVAAADHDPAASARTLATPPTLPTQPTVRHLLPAGATNSPRRLSVAGWFGAELLDLFPWRGRLEKRDILLNSVGLLLALAVAWVWLLGAAGKLDQLTILGWWLLWSAYEIAARMQTKPLVREGAWWRRDFRKASWADMLAYVGIKNILLASLLFFIIRTDRGLGLWLQQLPNLV